MNASSRKTITAGLLALLGIFSICNACLWCPLFGMVTKDFIIAINTLSPRVTTFTQSSTHIQTLTITPTANQTLTSTFTYTREPSMTLTNTPFPSSTFTATFTSSPSETPIAVITVPSRSGGQNCDPSYPDVCIPPPPPDLDCKDITSKNFKVLPPDPHHLDRNENGVGCETGE